jgi:hypothetical protein
VNFVACRLECNDIAAQFRVQRHDFVVDVEAERLGDRDRLLRYFLKVVSQAFVGASVSVIQRLGGVVDTPVDTPVEMNEHQRVKLAAFA